MQNGTPAGGYQARVVDALRHLGYRPELVERHPDGHYYADHLDPWVATCPACYVAFGDVAPTLTVSATLGCVCWARDELGTQHPAGLIESILGLGPKATAPAPADESPTPPRASSVRPVWRGLPRGL